MTLCNAHPAEEKWVTVLGATGYEVSTRGGWARCDGTPLAVRPNNSGYPQVDYTRDDGKRVKGRPLHTVMLESLDRPRPDGMEACHLDDNPAHLCWPENLRWDAPEGNRRDRMRNRPAAPPKPKAICVMCRERPVTKGSKSRCHECVVWLGEQAGKGLADSRSITELAEELHYPSVEGLQRLAERYGGYGVPPLPGDTVNGHAELRPSWLRRVTARLARRVA